LKLDTAADVEEYCKELKSSKPNEIHLSGNTFGVEALAAISKCLGDELRVRMESLSLIAFF
jgi:Ran GTPase-activating protein (RanGAP) involved in mRNA processing and transport